MDRHVMQDKITAEDIARMHQEDLKIEHLYNCRGLTYWCDEVRRTAFCLIEAPNAQAIHDMHNDSHGSMAHTVIEVDPFVVESFLGRIGDPKKEKGAILNIIKEPAYRFIAVIKLQQKAKILNTSSKNYEDLMKITKELISISQGRVVKKSKNQLLTSFREATHAVMALLAIKKHFKENKSSNLTLSIGLSSGVPLEQKDGELFEKTVCQCQYFCDIIPYEFVLSAPVKELFDAENNEMDRTLLNNSNSFFLSRTQEQFLTIITEFMETEYINSDLKITDIAKKIGHSKATLYRKINELTGVAPNAFIREFRLRKSLELLKTSGLSVSEIAYKSGFNTPSFFAKKFKEYYNISPSSLRLKN